MKICYVCADPGIPIYGRKGCSTHVRETCLALTQLGHEVKVLCSNIEGDREEGGGGFDTVDVTPPKSRKLGFDLRHILLNRRLERRLVELIEQWQPDAIYERYSLYSRAGGRVSRRFRLPRLLEINAFLTREQKGRIRLPWLARRVERSIIGQASHSIVVSEPLRQEVDAIGGGTNAISKMPMAVNLEKFNPNDNGSAIRRRYDLGDQFIVGYVGTLAGWHGINLLYEVAERLKRSAKHRFAFLIVGGDARKLELHRSRTSQAGLDELIRFVGSVPYDEVPSHIRAMDVGLVPDTTYWSSPAKLFEYQACAVPVLAPSYPAIHEALDHGVEGFIYPPRDTEKISELIIQLMDNPNLCASMGQAARSRAEREHSWRANGEQIIELFKQAGAREHSIPSPNND